MKINKIAALGITLSLMLAACGREKQTVETTLPLTTEATVAAPLQTEEKEYRASYKDAMGKPAYEIFYTLPRFPEENAIGQKINAYFDSLFQAAKSNGSTFAANLTNLTKPYRESAACVITYADKELVSFDVTIQLDSGSGDEVLSRELSTFSRTTGQRISLDVFVTSEQALNFLSSSVVSRITEDYTTLAPDGATVYNALNRQAFCLTANGFRVAFPSGTVTVSERGPIVIDFNASDCKGYFDALPNIK